MSVPEKDLVKFVVFLLSKDVNYMMKEDEYMW
jgi:hypothetical protein